MKRIAIMLIAACISGIFVALDAVCNYGDGFQKRELSAYLANITPDLAAKIKFLPAEDGQGVMLQATAGMKFKMEPVRDDVKYRLSFRARQDGLETIEENPRLAAAVFNRSSLHPYYQLIFYGEDGKTSKGKSPAIAMPFGAFHEYVHVFYPPKDACSMQLVIGVPSKGSTVYLSDIKFLRQTEEGAINVNPKFELGPCNYSGWKGFNEADGVHQWYTDADHGTVLFTALTAFSESFPLKEPGTYKLYQKGSNHVRNNGTNLIFFDASGKEISRITRKLSRNAREQKDNFYGPKEDTYYFVLPKGTLRAHFWIYNTVLHELSITRVGDEGAYQKLPGDGVR